MTEQTVADAPQASHEPFGFTPYEHAVLNARGVYPSDTGRLMLYDVWKRTGLDPFAGQIYLTLRNNNFRVETTIDGLRTIAEASGSYRGQDGPYWCGTDGEWTDVWLHTYPPVAAKVGVRRSGWDHPLYAVARFTEYAGYKTGGGALNVFWSKMSALMIAKVAEALAIRRTFPQTAGGIYTADEMAQADNPEPAEAGVSAKARAEAVAAAVAVAEATKGLEDRKAAYEALRDLWTGHAQLLDDPAGEDDERTLRQVLTVMLAGAVRSLSSTPANGSNDATTDSDMDHGGVFYACGCRIDEVMATGSHRPHAA